MIKNNNIPYYVYYLFLLIVFFVFFSQIHPLLPFDTDDWIYSGYSRPPYPSLNEWNPTKILPECLQPAVAFTAAYFVTPIVGDYLNALVFSHAFVVSLFIIIYLYSVQRLLEWKFKTSRRLIFCIVLVYILLHFLILKINDSSNGHLLYSIDVNSYYNYTIPNLLNASLVLWLLRHNPQDITRTTTYCILLFATFLALFSNLYSSVILIAYIGAKLLLDLATCNKKENNWMKNYIRQHAYFLTVVLIWLGIQIFEASGNRANSYGYMSTPFIMSLREIKYFIVKRIHFNGWFLAFTITVLIGAKICYFFKGNHKIFNIGKNQILLILALLLSCIYLILLSSRVYPVYLLRADITFSYTFFYLLLVVLCMGYLSSRLRTVKLLYPFLIFFFLFMLNTEENTFKDVQYWHEADLTYCEKFDRDVIRQLQTAEALGQDTVTIYVHKFNDGSNWPLKPIDGNRIGITLQKHGIIKRKIVTKIELLPAELDTLK